MWCPNGGLFVAMCFVTRSVEAFASAAQNVATSAIGAFVFPNNVSMVMVCYFSSQVVFQLLWYMYVILAKEEIIQISTSVHFYWAHAKLMINQWSNSKVAMERDLTWICTQSWYLVFDWFTCRFKKKYTPVHQKIECIYSSGIWDEICRS